MKRFAAVVSILVIAAFYAEAQAVRSFVGTVSNIQPESGGVEVKPDNRDRLIAKISTDTVLQRIATGEKDLKKAEPIPLSVVAPGDRVLVSLDLGTNTARRIVVMSGAEIGKRNETERQDWIER